MASFSFTLRLLTVEKVSCHVVKTLKQLMKSTTMIRNWELLLAVWVKNLEVDLKASVKISNDCDLSWYLESLILTRWWARTTQLSHSQTPEQQKLWNNKCLLFYLFVGCAGSSLLYAGFVYVQQEGATLPCGVWASHCSGFSWCRAQILGGAWAQ